jgi:tetratricopeptide (TPR) repeat protein
VIGLRKEQIKFFENRRSFCGVSPSESEISAGLKPKSGEDSFKKGWYSYLPEGVEARRVIEFEEPLERQFALVEENEGDRHVRYDLVTLCLRTLRSPLTEEYDKCSVLLAVAESSLKIISQAEKFRAQLKSHLEKHITPFQRLDIKTKIGEHKAKLIKTEWSSIPLMAAYAHYLMLDGQLEEAWKVVNRSMLLSQSLLYFQLGLELEEEAETNETLLIPAARMYCRSVMRNPQQSESWTNLAVLEFYRNVDTSHVMEMLEEEEKKKKIGKGYNSKKRKADNEKSLKDRRKQALACLDRAIASDEKKKNFIAYYHKGFILETGMDELNWKEKSRENYSKALEINPDHIQSLSHLGSLLMDEKLYDKALKHFQHAKEVGKGEILVLLNLAHCHAKMGHIEAAMKEMVAAMRREPHLPELQYQMGMILLREASKEKEKELNALNPKNSEDSALLGGSGVYGASKRKSEALSFFQRSLELHSAHPDIPFDSSKVYNIMITLLREMAQQALEEGETVKDFVRASKLLLRALDLLPPLSSLFPPLLISLSFALMKSNRPLQALSALQDAKLHFSNSNRNLSPENPQTSTQDADSHKPEVENLGLSKSESKQMEISSSPSPSSSSPLPDIDSESKLVEEFEAYFRAVQQANQDSKQPQIVFHQLEQHFNALEQTDALIGFLSSSLSNMSDLDYDVELETSKDSLSPFSSLSSTLSPSSIKKKKKIKKITVGKSVKKIQGKSKTSKSLKGLKSETSASPSSQSNQSPLDMDVVGDDESMKRLDEAIKREMEAHSEEFKSSVPEASSDEHHNGEVVSKVSEKGLKGKKKKSDQMAKEEELERLLIHKAKLHYNIAFCMHYIGEVREIEKHLMLALQAAPEEELCTSDYIIFDNEVSDEHDDDESLVFEDPNVRVGFPEEEMAKISKNGKSSHSSLPPSFSSSSLANEDGSNEFPSSFGIFKDDQIILDELRRKSLKQSQLKDSIVTNPDIIRTEDDEDEVMDQMDKMMEEMGEVVDDKDENIDSESLSESLVGSKHRRARHHPDSVEKIKRRVTVKPYSERGLEEQLEALMHPPDGSKPSHSTEVLLEWLSGVQEKYQNLSMEDLDSKILKVTGKPKISSSTVSGAAPIRSAKSKRRKNLKYSIQASKKFRSGGPDDGFDSPL